MRRRATATATDSPSGHSTTFQSAGWSVRTSEPTAMVGAPGDQWRIDGGEPTAARLSPSAVSASTTTGPPKMSYAPSAAADSSSSGTDAVLIARVVSASRTIRAASDSARCRAE